MAQSYNTSSLLDLPDVIVDTIISGLAPADQRRFMAVCRGAARMMSVNANETTLKITKDTKFTGIQKVITITSTGKWVYKIIPRPCYNTCV